MTSPDMLPGWWWALLGALLGGSLASFLGVVLERAPRGETIAGRSRCACGRLLRPSENVPVVGWLRARGRARCCGASIPARYLAGETAGAVLLAALGAGARGAGIAAGAGAALLVAVVVLARTRRTRKDPRPGDATGGRSAP